MNEQVFEIVNVYEKQREKKMETRIYRAVLLVYTYPVSVKARSSSAAM